MRYSLLAGEQALAAYAWDEALAHFEIGLVARDVTLSGTEAASDEEAAALLFGLGRARVATTEPLHPLQDALDTLRRAFDYYVDAGDVEHAVAIAEYPYFPRFGYSYGSSQLVARALSLVPSGSHAACRLLFRYGLILGVEEGDSVGAREAMESAFAIAEREEDTDLEMRILAASARLDRFGLGMEETLRKSQRAIELAVRLKDLRTEAAARYEAGIALRNMGDLVESEKHAAAMLDASERLRDRQLLILALNINAGGSRRKGDWRAAREYCLRGLEVSGDGDSRLPLAYLAEIGYQVGNIDEGNQSLDQLVEAMRATTPGPTVPYSYPAITIPLAAQITGVPSKFDVAEEAAGIILKGPSANSAVEQAARAGLAFMAVSRGDAEAAAEQYQLLESAPWTQTTVFWVHRGRLLGLLAQTMGNVEQAAAHLEEATAFYRKTAHRPDLALTCREYADTLLQQNGPGDREKAMSVMEEALAISRELGMLPLTERIIALQQRAESLPVTIPAYPDGLTQREVEVLRLIAAGKSNREISEELVITLNTVFRHVSNIFTKIGSSNRVEAASYASRHGLAPGQSEGTP